MHTAWAASGLPAGHPLHCLAGWDSLHCTAHAIVPGGVYEKRLPLSKSHCDKVPLLGSALGETLGQEGA